MAYQSTYAQDIKGAVAGQAIQEGRLVRLVASGLKEDLPTALLAASGTTKNVYVAFVPEDNFSRPTPASVYAAGWRSTTYGDTSTAWGDFVETDDMYRVGLSTLENPFIPSGYVVKAMRGVDVTVPSGCTVDAANLRVRGNFVKVSDDGTGRWEYTASESLAIGEVIDWNPTNQYYTFRRYDN